MPSHHVCAGRIFNSFLSTKTCVWWHRHDSGLEKWKLRKSTSSLEIPHCYSLPVRVWTLGFLGRDESSGARFPEFLNFDDNVHLPDEFFIYWRGPSKFNLRQIILLKGQNDFVLLVGELVCHHLVDDLSFFLPHISQVLKLSHRNDESEMSPATFWKYFQMFEIAS